MVIFVFVQLRFLWAIYIHIVLFYVKANEIKTFRRLTCGRWGNEIQDFLRKYSNEDELEGVHIEDVIPEEAMDKITKTIQVMSKWEEQRRKEMIKEKNGQIEHKSSNIDLKKGAEEKKSFERLGNNDDQERDVQENSKSTLKLTERSLIDLSKASKKRTNIMARSHGDNDFDENKKANEYHQVVKGRKNGLLQSISTQPVTVNKLNLHTRRASEMTGQGDRSRMSDANMLDDDDKEIDQGKKSQFSQNSSNIQQIDGLPDQKIPLNKKHDFYPEQRQSVRPEQKHNDSEDSPKDDQDSPSSKSYSKKSRSRKTKSVPKREKLPREKLE